jgi:hypothetical protein
MPEVEIPTARELSIIVADPMVETNQPKMKCKMYFCAIMCSLGLFMFAWLLFIFWNQRPR